MLIVGRVSGFLFAIVNFYGGYISKLLIGYGDLFSALLIYISFSYLWPILSYIYYKI